MNPVRNFSGALAAQALAQRVKPNRNYLECNPAGDKRGIISNEVNRVRHDRYSPITWTRISLSRLRLSKSMKTICCHVPKVSLRLMRGMVRDGFIKAALT